MTFPSLLQIKDRFEGVLLDAFGVFWAGNSRGPLPGAKETMAQLVAEGKIVGILSNSTQLVTKELDKYAKQGIVQGKHFHFLLTSGQIAKSLFSSSHLPFAVKNKKFWIWGEPHPKFFSHQAIFEGSSFTETSDISEADFIYISIPHRNGLDLADSSSFERQAQELFQTGLPMVCANPDRFAHEGNPPTAVIRQGSLAELYENLGGTVFYIGKPSSIAFEQAFSLFQQHKNLRPDQIVMVGDTPETDVRGARKLGLASALVTKTGIMSDRILKQGFEKTVQTFPPTDLPDFFIEVL